MTAAWWLSGLLLGLAAGAGYVSWLDRRERDERQAQAVEYERAARWWQQRFVHAERARMAERDRADRAEAALRRDVDRLITEALDDDDPTCPGCDGYGTRVRRDGLEVPCKECEEVEE